MNESTLSPTATYCLATIRREHPVMASVLRSDIRTRNNSGPSDLDENRVFRSLDELQGLGLIAETLGGWRPVYSEPVAKAKQGQLSFQD